MARRRKKVGLKAVLTRNCDAVWSEIVRESDGHQCQLCGRRGSNAHHFFSRRHAQTRWETNNGITLCWACHIHHAHVDPELVRDRMIERIGENAFLALKRMAYGRPGRPLTEQILINTLRMLLLKQLRLQGGPMTAESEEFALLHRYGHRESYHIARLVGKKFAVKLMELIDRKDEQALVGLADRYYPEKGSKRRKAQQAIEKARQEMGNAFLSKPLAPGSRELEVS